MTSVGTLVPRLPRQAWLVLGGDAVSALGSGLTLPFFLVYLHQVRGIELGVAGPILSTIAVMGLVGNPLGGLLTDRFGPRRPAAAGLVVAAAGTAGMIAVQSAWQGFLAAGVYGLGVAITEPSFQTILGTSVPAERRSQVFAARHAVFNVGLGAGSLLAAFLVSFSEPETFVAIYALDAATFVAFAVLIALTADTRAGEPDVPEPAPVPAGGGYREILADRVLLRICVCVAAVFACGYAQYYSAYPIFATQAGGLDAAELQLTFVANTLTVVLAQLLVLRLLAGRRRTRGFALSAGLMAVAWAAVPVTAFLGGGVAGAAGFTVVMIVFAVGETLMSPTIPALVNDLASDATRGRYNGAYTLAGTCGQIIGPGVAGVALGAGHGVGLFAALALVLGLVAMQVLRLERRVPASVNLVGDAAPARSSSAA
ncbi:MFS family permease [Streptosporangium becharense]|uniref:MFS family permease n=1 Tax=Streptosporangium becharense TaxID=1816182 RepID=A0A7W9IL86_9ACTN|nr:MFS transporter [Streptosporangium becharense]MBB2911425.1 MFS family permease [Streptosporangium becharense]MBB5822757.1 MFS family permease [Streptosporangium becharense]